MISILALTAADGCGGREEGRPADRLYAGAGRIDITPRGFETYRDCGCDDVCPGEEGYAGPDGQEEGNSRFDRCERFLDCGPDRLCPGDEGYAEPDEGEGDAEFQAVYLGGFYNGIAATGVHDSVFATVLVLERGPARLAIVSFDLVGLMEKYTNYLKRRIFELYRFPREAVVVCATHNHEGPDSMGLWATGGVDQEWIRAVMDGVIEEFGRVLGRMAEVGMTSAAFSPDSCCDPDTLALKKFPDCREPASRKDLESGGFDMPLYMTDTRDPFVRDVEVRAAGFVEKGTGRTVATLINWSNHLETLADENTLISSDFAGPLRETVEEKSGGIAVYTSGALGGMMTPLRPATAPAMDGSGAVEIGPDGKPILLAEASFEKAEAIGRGIGLGVVGALSAAALQEKPALKVRTDEVMIPIDPKFRVLLDSTEYFDPSDKTLTAGDPEKCGEYGCIRTWVTYARIGDVEMLTAPGELLPEIFIGRPESVVDYGDEGFPECRFGKLAGVKSFMSGKVNMFIGLANMELGYILPDADVLGDDSACLGGKKASEHPNYYEEGMSASGKMGYFLCDKYLEMLGAGVDCAGNPLK